MLFINAKDVYDWYVEDVIDRNNKAMETKKQIKEYSDKLPLDSVKKYVEELYALERREFGERQRKTDDNDFDTFKRNVRVNVIMDNFAERAETKEVMDSLKQARDNKDYETLNSIVDKLYATFGSEIIERKIEEKIWRNRLICKSMEFSGCKLIGEEFETEFNPERVNGNCTKGITVSLYRAAKEFGLNIYKTSQDKEDAAHPKTLIEQLDKYIKPNKRGLLEDVENIRVGDIVVLANQQGEPKHTMMVSSFDEQGKPLLLGFTATQKNIHMFESKKTGEPRKGWVIDVHSFINDKVNEHNRQEMANKLFCQQKDMSD